MSQPSIPEDIYPIYHDADVLIVSMTGRSWKLHSRILANGSPVLKDIFVKMPPARIRREDKQEGNLIQWKLQMIKHHAAGLADPHGTHYAYFMALDPHKKQPLNLDMFSGTVQGSKFDAIYDNMFRIFYNLDPKFSPAHASNDEAAPMYEALNLLTAAGYLKAYPAVRLVIESLLLSFNQLLWYEIEHRPEVWASVACKLQSAPMFRESMIHLAGRYHLKGVNAVKQHLLGNIEWGAAILELLRQKGKELKDYKLQTERFLFEYVPKRMHHEAKSQVGGLVAPGRAIYANDVYWWMSLHLIRQYFSSAVLQNRHHRAADGGMSFYRTIAAPHSYLLDDDYAAFHATFAMTPKSRAVFVHALNKLKNDIAAVVAGLLVNHSLAQKPADSEPYKYLTCTVVLDEELPWIKETSAATTTVDVRPINASGQATPSPDANATIAIVSTACNSPTACADINSNSSSNLSVDGGRGGAVQARASASNDVILQLGSAIPTVSQGHAVSAKGNGTSVSASTLSYVLLDTPRTAAAPPNSVDKLAPCHTNALPGVLEGETGSKTVDIIVSKEPRNASHNTEAVNKSIPARRVSPQKQKSSSINSLNNLQSASASVAKTTKRSADDIPSDSNSIAPSKKLRSSSTATPIASSKSKAQLSITTSNAQLLTDALAFNLIPHTQRVAIHAKAEAAHSKGIPNMQGLLEKPFGKTDRAGLNQKFRDLVKAGIVGQDK